MNKWTTFRKKEFKSTKEVIAANTDLNWSVSSKNICIQGGAIINGKKAIIRNDTNEVLGVVNSSFKYVQNSEAFSIYDDFLKKRKVFCQMTGLIGKGEKVWFLINLNNNLKIANNDSIQRCILISNAHDGRGSIRAYFVPIRIISQTLLNIAFGKRVDQGIQIRHIGKIEQRLKEAHALHDLSFEFYREFEEKVQILTNCKFNQRKMSMFFENCFHNYSFDSTRTQNTIQKIKVLYEKEVKLFPNYINSAWAWFNALVGFVDNERISKGKSLQERNSNHIESLFWGSGLRLKQKAWETIQTIIKI